MTLTQIKQALVAHRFHPTKALGQNFLHDANQIQRIVAAAELEGADSILEIGPGLGALTAAMLPRVSRMLAIETDARLVRFLRERFAAAGTRLELVHADALRELEDAPRDWEVWKCVANLPYAVASPILVALCQAPVPPRRCVVTVQFEVAQRLAARPQQEAYGLLTLLVQVCYEVTGMFKIAAGCFYPRPNVESACVVLDRRPAPLLASAAVDAFERVVRRGFSQRRKMLFKLLRADWPEAALRLAFERAALRPDVRAEALPLETFVHLVSTLCPMAPAAHP
jgi:16S rRNA (adenine1518-N6/adenine1519-N6)-dimethyltransferase